MRRLLRPLTTAAAAGLWLALAAVAASALLRPGHRYAELLLQFAAPALVVALLALAAAALLRRPGLASGFAVMALALGAALAPGWRGHPPAGGEPLARVYVANLWARNEEVERMAASVADADAEVVVLIELGDAAAARLDEILAGYPHRVATPRIDRPSGAARSVVASRWPLEARDREVADGLSVVTAEVRLPDGSRLRVLGAHLTRPWPFQWEHAQARQAERLAARVGAGPERTVVVGDFNAVRLGRPVRRLTGEAGLRLAPAAWGTWPAALPAPLRITIDQALVSPDLVVVRRTLGRPTGSDHRPVIVEVAPAAEAAR